MGKDALEDASNSGREGEGIPMMIFKGVLWWGIVMIQVAVKQVCVRLLKCILYRMAWVWVIFCIFAI